MILKSPQWDHQKRACEFVINRKKGSMLAIPMGGGKTKVAVDLIQNADVENILVTCPLSVVPAWGSELQKHLKYPEDYRVVLLDEGTVKERAAYAERVMEKSKRIKIFVTNYQAVWREPFRKFALGNRWDAVLPDESHRIKAAGGKASLFFKELRKRTRYGLALSGTPMPHSPLDLYAQARFIDDSVFGTRKDFFVGRYCFLGGSTRNQIIGWQNLDELNEKFHEFAFRVDDSELDLPEEVDVHRYTRLEPSAQKIYKELQREFIVQVQKGTITAANALVKQLRLQQIAGGWVKDIEGEYHHVSSAKLDLLEDLLKDAPANEPLVIVCRFLHEIAAVHRVLHRMGRSSSELSGHRKDLAKWQSGRTLDLVVQISSGSEGIDLTRSRYTIFYSPGVQLGTYQQMRRRTARPNQKHPQTTYIHLIARGTEDERTYRAFANNMEIIEMVQREET